MKAEYINPFISSVESVFETMLNTSIKRLDVRAGSGSIERQGKTLTSIIGISGNAHGVVALSFPLQTAMKLAGKLACSEYSEVNQEVTDALAEMANMVGGSAKSKFDLDPPPELSLPTVVDGCDYKMKYPTKSVWIEVPFNCVDGDFKMEVSFSTED